jgi:hypothetical protein
MDVEGRERREHVLEIERLRRQSRGGTTPWTGEVEPRQEQVFETKSRRYDPMDGGGRIVPGATIENDSGHLHKYKQ